MAELCSIRAGYAEEFAEIRWKVGGRSGISEAQGHGAVIAAFVLTTLEEGRWWKRCSVVPRNYAKLRILVLVWDAKKGIDSPRWVVLRRGATIFR